MPILRVKLAELQPLSDPSSEGLGAKAGAPGGTADLKARIQCQFRFLPHPITVKVEDDEVVVEVPEEKTGSRGEAASLAEKAGKRASEGNYGRAIAIYLRVLELQPSLNRARRDLAMIYAGGKNDPETGEKFIRETLELNLQDTWALNSHATFTQKEGRREGAQELFGKAIATFNGKLGRARQEMQVMLPELLTGKTI